MAHNQAAWLDGANKPLRVGEAPMPEPGPDEIVIRNRAVAINPVDWKIQDYGAFVKKWPMVIGTDVAGEVVSTGANVKRFRTGDRVAAHMISLLSNKEQDGAFQLYSAAVAGKTAHLPSNVSFAQGSVIPLALDTAAVGLYTSASEGGLGLPYPSLNPSSSGKTIFVWGGSSSVGALAIQLAVGSGAKVVATASKHNFDFCRGLGASEVVDYKSANVVEEVVSAIKSIGGEYVGTYDAISEQDKSYNNVIPIIEKLSGNGKGSGSLAVVLGAPEKAPSGVKVLNVFGINEFTHKIWEEYVTKALEEGKLKCLPEPLVVGKGLESVQKGLDENKKGVSARKVVVELD